MITPAGIESGWRWQGKSKVIVVTISSEALDRFSEQKLGLLPPPTQLHGNPQSQDAHLTDTAVMLLQALQDGGPGYEVMRTKPSDREGSSGPPYAAQPILQPQKDV